MDYACGLLLHLLRCVLEVRGCRLFIVGQVPWRGGDASLILRNIPFVLTCEGSLHAWLLKSEGCCMQMTCGAVWPGPWPSNPSPRSSNDVEHVPEGGCGGYHAEGVLSLLDR